MMLLSTCFDCQTGMRVPITTGMRLPITTGMRLLITTGMRVPITTGNGPEDSNWLPGYWLIATLPSGLWWRQGPSRLAARKWHGCEIGGLRTADHCHISWTVVTIAGVEMLYHVSHYIWCCNPRRILQGHGANFLVNNYARNTWTLCLVVRNMANDLVVTILGSLVMSH